MPEGFAKAVRARPRANLAVNGGVGVYILDLTQYCSFLDQEAASGPGPLIAQRGKAMNMTVEQNLLSKLRTLSAQQVAEVEDFVEFLAAKSRKRAALDRLLAIAPALAAAGAEPPSEDEIEAEVQAARSERRARLAGQAATRDSGADRS